MSAVTIDELGGDELYRQAIDELCGGDEPLHRAHTHLLYGELLRREHRRVAARRHLRVAYQTFRALGQATLAERARAGVAAASERVGAAPGRPHEPLTAQEEAVARLAALGLTNRAIGARLYLSPHTVSHHLRGVYRKLGITSRRQLAPTPVPAPLAGVASVA